MIDETKLREKLTAVLERSQYGNGNLWTFQRKNLINAVMQAVKECEASKQVKKQAKKARKKEAT